LINWWAEANVVGYLSLKVQYTVKVKLLGRPRRDAQTQVIFRHEQSILFTRH
jgi:hypothetical protein